MDEFAAAYERSKGRLVRAASLIVGDVDAAADAVAEAFARTYPRWRSGRVADLDAYLYRAVVNECLNTFRRRNVHALPRERPIDDHADDVATRRVVSDLLAELSPRARAIVVLRFVADLSERETAMAADVPLGTVKSTVSRALTTLRQSLNEEPTDDRR